MPIDNRSPSEHEREFIRMMKKVPEHLEINSYIIDAYKGLGYTYVKGSTILEALKKVCDHYGIYYELNFRTNIGNRAEIYKLAREIKKRTNPEGKEKEFSEERLKAFYESWDWKRIRYSYLSIAPKRCMCCGATGKIVVDHIKPVRYYWHLRLDIDNLQILCEDCNMGKGFNDETDWRPKNSS